MSVREPPIPPPETRRSRAYDVLDALVKPSVAWDERLIGMLPGRVDEVTRVRQPDYAAMYVLPGRGTVSARSVAELQTRLERGAAVRAYLVSQKGAGKSMALRYLASRVTGGHTPFFVSLSGWNGVAMDDVAIQDVLLVIAAAVANELAPSVLGSALSDDTLELARRFALEVTFPGGLGEAKGPPANLDAFGKELTRAARAVPDSGTFREKLRERNNVELLVALVNQLLRMGNDGNRRPLLFLDDGDKIRGEAPYRIFLQNEHTLAELRCDLIATVPFSLKWREGLGALTHHTPFELRNVPVVHFGQEDQVLPAAVAWFRELLNRVLDSSVFPEPVLARAVRLSAGIPAELGKLLRAALFDAGLEDDTAVDLGHLASAVRVQRRPLESATHNALNRERLRAVRSSKRLDVEADYRLVDANMLVQYGNDTEDLWFDVHPLLEEVVDRWPAP